MSIPPPTAPLRGELGGVVRALSRAPRLLRQGERTAQPLDIIVVPGYLTGDAATLVLRRYLAGLGHTVRGWGLGINAGGGVGRLAAQVAADVARRPGPVTLIGWSLGGVVAREVARARPEQVERVITLGTPVMEGPRATRFGPLLARLGVDLDAVAAQVARRGAVPAPVVGFYSRRDAVVAWRACLDPHPGARFTPVEVAVGHLAMVLDPGVLRLIGERLATTPSP